MAGHSKWAKVKHFKGAIDAKRARIFAKLSREITVAAKVGGGDPDRNPRLRMALLKCRGANMPSDNIERAVKKGAGGGEVADFEELSTDNRNRTAAEVRSLLSKNGGTIATAGSVSRLFQRKGQIIVSREASDEDRLMELALEAGAEDFKAEPEGYEIITAPSNFEVVHRRLETKGVTCEAAEVTWLPAVTVPVSKANSPAVHKLIDSLEEHDDVKEIHTNAEFPDAVE